MSAAHQPKAEQTDHSFGILLLGRSGKTFRFHCASESERETWIKSLSSMLDRFNQKQIAIESPMLQEKTPPSDIGDVICVASYKDIIIMGTKNGVYTTSAAFSGNEYLGNSFFKKIDLKNVKAIHVLAFFDLLIVLSDDRALSFAASQVGNTQAYIVKDFDVIARNVSSLNCGSCADRTYIFAVQSKRKSNVLIFEPTGFGEPSPGKFGNLLPKRLTALRKIKTLNIPFEVQGIYLLQTNLFIAHKRGFKQINMSSYESIGKDIFFNG